MLKKTKAAIWIIVILFVVFVVFAVVIGKYNLFEDNNIGVCNYDDLDKNYIKKNVSECEVVNYLCAKGNVPFKDECGCGCISNSVDENNESTIEHSCTSENRGANACIQLYQPVCGWFNATKIQCIKYPCAQTYSNSCFACANEDVSYWTDGECPK